MTLPIVVMPDAELAAVAAVRDFLGSQSDWVDVQVVTQIAPATTPTHLVRIRRKGGRVSWPVTDSARLDVLIWHDTPYKRMQLGQLVQAFLVAMAGQFGDVTCYGGQVFMTPTPMPDPDDDTREIVMLTVDVSMRGTQLDS